MLSICLIILYTIFLMKEGNIVYIKSELCLCSVITIKDNTYLLENYSRMRNNCIAHFAIFLEFKCD